jgi:N-carbamoyl-L-amino-acid hydrolase
MSLSVRGPRLWRALEEFGRIGAEPDGRGRTRLAFSGADREAREELIRRLRAIGAEIRIDPIGNLFGLLPGREPDLPAVAAGSHLDTVVRAGAFDGATGVLAALECLTRVREEGIRPRRSLALACFVNEEGARFQPDMMGSLFAAGLLSLASARAARDDRGRSVGEELERLGMAGTDRFLPGAYLELHVEQGPRLFDEGIPIGVVRGVVGIAWRRILFRGEANHAGSTPMGRRRDALGAARDLAASAEALARELGEGGVATVGCLSLEPDVINVVPALCRMTLDMRCADPDRFALLRRILPERIEAAARGRGCSVETEVLAEVEPVRFDPELSGRIRAAAAARGLPTRDLVSGAGHDAGILASRIPSAMIFVPSREGRSHCPEEWTEPEAIEGGANVLLDVWLETAERV